MRSIFKVVLSLLLLVTVASTSAVNTLQVTIGGGANTQISASDLYVKQLFVQNNAAHNIRVGDSNTSTTRGALLSGSASPPGGSITVGPFANSPVVLNLKEWYVAGTAADVVDVIYIQ